MKLAEFSIRQAIIATSLDAFTIAAAVDDGTLPSLQRGAFFYVHRDNLAAFAAAHGHVIDDSKIQAGDFANQLATQTTSAKPSSPTKPAASGLIDLAKQAAAKAGKPVVDHGPGIVGLARKAAAEFARKQK